MAAQCGLRTVAVALAAAICAGQQVTIDISTASGAYAVKLDGSVWLSSGPYSVHYGGKQYTSVPGGGLSLTGSSTFQGSDVIGAYNGTALTWTGPAGGSFETRFLYYSANNAIAFEQVFPDGLTGTALYSAGAYNDLTSAFPTFAPDATPEESGLAYTAWNGCMCPGHTGQWSQQSSFAFGREAGVLAIFNASASTVVISAANNFMVAALAWPSGVGNKVFGAGLMVSCGSLQIECAQPWLTYHPAQGTVDPIPAGFSHRTLLVAGQGVNSTMHAWGDALLALGNKTRPGPDVDMVVSQLSYWTDNGAWPGRASDPTTPLVVHVRCLLLLQHRAECDVRADDVGGEELRNRHTRPSQ